MFISDFQRIDTLTVPDVFLSMVTVSADSDGFDPDEVLKTVDSDKDSIDYLAIRSESDPLDFKDLYSLIRRIRPKGVKVLLVTDGRSPTVLDDLVGAGYVHAVNLIIDRELTEEQVECLDIARDNKCKYYVTTKARLHDQTSIERLAYQTKGCTMFILEQDRKSPLKPSEMSSLSAAVKKHSWNVRQR